MKKANGAYIVVDLETVVPEEKREQYGLKELQLSDSLYVHAVGQIGKLVPDTPETTYKSLPYRGTLVRFNDKYWSFDYASPLGTGVAAIIATSFGF